MSTRRVSTSWLISVITCVFFFASSVVGVASFPFFTDFEFYPYLVCAIVAVSQVGEVIVVGVVCLEEPEGESCQESHLVG